MTKKDYELIANALKQAKPDPRDEISSLVAHTSMYQWRGDVNAIAKALGSDNESFDRRKFLRACGAIDAADALEYVRTGQLP